MRQGLQSHDRKFFARIRISWLLWGFQAGRIALRPYDRKDPLDGDDRRVELDLKQPFVELQRCLLDSIKPFQGLQRGAASANRSRHSLDVDDAGHKLAPADRRARCDGRLV